jgi:outer membrane receptor protein involved in Fe transport
MNRLKGALLGGASLVIGLNANAFAQQASTPPSSGIETVVVTAQRRTEDVQKVSLAVTVLNGAALTDSGVKKFQDFALLAPSVSFYSFGATQDKVVIRGVSSGTAFESQSATTGFYIDEIPVSSSYTSGGSDMALFDLDHVEVLRGPQGTLYGAGSEGGAIRVITKQPDFSGFSADVELTGAGIAGRAAEFDADGEVNIPLIDDKLALRVVGTYINQGGYIDDPIQNLRNINGVIRTNGRAELEYRPTSDLTVTLTALYQRTTSDGQPTVDLTLGKQPLFGDLTQNRYVQEWGVSKSDAVNLVVKYDMPWAELVSSTSFIEGFTDRMSDATLSNGAIFPRLLGGLPPERYSSELPASDKTYVEELRLVSTDEHPFKWVFGAYYQNDNIGISRFDRFLPGQPLSIYVPLNFVTDTLRQTYSVFGEGTYDFDDQWHVTAGARYTSVPNTFLTDVYGLAFGLKFLTPAQAIVGSGQSTSNDFSPKLELTYTPADNMLFYAEAAHGFRPGTANPQLAPAILGVPADIPPESLWDYELGAKTQFFDGRLTLNGDIYLINWKNIQVVATTPASASQPSIPFYANVGRARSKGAELELTAHPIDNFSVSLTGAYDDAYFSEANSIIHVLKGERIASVPQWSGSISLDYNHQLTDSIHGFAHFDLRYESDTTIGYSTISQGLTTSPYALLGINFGADLPSDTRVTFFIHNLTDDRAELTLGTNYCSSIPTCTGFNPNVATSLTALVAEPRTFGITVAKRF